MSPGRSSGTSGPAEAGPDTRFQFGTGFLIDAHGLIVTCEHVIRQADVVHVVLSDRTRHRAAVQGADPRSDLAVLRIAPTALAPVELAGGDSARTGQPVIALGSGSALDSDARASASFGLVSAMGRALPESFGRAEDRFYGDLLQTSAAIQPGDSGGPLIDLHGRVVGVITVMTSYSAAAHDGPGFAIPINARTRTILESLKQGRPVEYGYLGLQSAPPDEQTARQAGLSGPRGALVVSVDPRGPADAAGLRPADIVTRFGDAVVRSDDHLVALIGATRPGRLVEIEYRRDGAAHRTNAVVARREAAPPVTMPLPAETRVWRGATLMPTDPARQAREGVGAGAMWVVRVESDSPADRAGLEPGNVISRMDGRPLTSTEETQRLLDAATADVLMGLVGGRVVLVHPR